jgi:hypothetical protein
MKIKICFIAIIIFLFFSENSYSNDSGIIAVGGTWVVMKGEHPSVQMESETIDMNVYKDFYDVVVEFTFKNNGEACDVFMGFPESGYGDMGGYRDSTTAFMMFSTSVNGVNVTAKREFVKHDEDKYCAYWVKQVSFKKDETKKIIVKYRSPFGSGMSEVEQGSDEFVSYVFSGGNWYGQVLESKLNIYFHIPVDVRLNKRTPLVKELDHYSYERKNWEAEEYLRINFKIKD